MSEWYAQKPQEQKYNIPYEDGKLWSLKELAAYLGLSYNALYGRIAKGWPPERWGEPMQQRRPPGGTPVETAEYTDVELLELYWQFAGQDNELTMLADFMGSDTEAASAQIVRWKAQGRI